LRLIVLDKRRVDISTHAHSEALNDVINRFQRLSPEEQEQLLEEIEAIVRQRVKNTQRPKHNVMEFEGMAKKLWEGVDVEKFIDEERNSWDAPFFLTNDARLPSLPNLKVLTLKEIIKTSQEEIESNLLEEGQE
jgi:hypothetical protein